MKNNKGIIRNLNKRLAAGTLALTLLTTGFTSCGSDDSNFFDVVQANESGEKTYTDKIHYSSLGRYRVVVFEKNEELSIFIAKTIEYYDHTNYLNIFDGGIIYNTSSSNLNIVSEEFFTDYLVMYDKVQAEYTAEEIEEILEQIKADYETKNNKQLVKGK